jgi:hypothetical protein
LIHYTSQSRYLAAQTTAKEPLTIREDGMKLMKKLTFAGPLQASTTAAAQTIEDLEVN